MKYTGLKDNKGTKIYVGDVLSTQSGKGYVEFSKGSFNLIDISNDIYKITTPLFLVEPCQYAQVIGNIHQNKELMEENQDD